MKLKHNSDDENIYKFHITKIITFKWNLHLQQNQVEHNFAMSRHI